jgi:formate dehydrogenase major subunit
MSSIQINASDAEHVKKHARLTQSSENRRIIVVTITIDGIQLNVNEDTTILEAASSVGIKIPTLCYDDRLKSTGACRMCVVEVEGARDLPASCTTPVREGMIVKTDTPRVKRSRKQVLELLWEDHPNECLTCQKAGECSLQDLCYEYDVEATCVLPEEKRHEIDSSNPFYTFDRDKCILCGKCVRVCEELQGVSAISFTQRGNETHISHPFEKGMDFSACVSCGNCVAVCPTGALMPKSKEKFRSWDIEKTVRTTCAYCGVGCQMDLQVKDNKVVRIDGARDGENDGLLCVKGKFAYGFLNHSDRLTHPLIKEEGVFRKASWDEVLGVVADKMMYTKDVHGSDTIAGLVSARCSNEDNYVMQKLFRGILKTNNVDHCARL